MEISTYLIGIPIIVLMFGIPIVTMCYLIKAIINGDYYGNIIPQVLGIICCILVLCIITGWFMKAQGM